MKNYKGLSCRHIATIFLVLMYAGCSFPHDASDAFNRAKSDRLLVGASKNSPFVVDSVPSPRGTEVDLLRQFAEEQGLLIEFEFANETSLVRKLTEGQLDVLIGGFDKETLWKQQVGLTMPYDGVHVVLIRKGENRLLYELEKSFKRLHK
ncbi:transporter substrate-binding domain-containing protein [uncultured Marinobacter sp.]|uniref:transporter substrate-binding domain-containing protein n=1 Tax=uncultured Marinobacter sp. TaxID=187379 RepID=UPI002628E5C7|nr:transporter substrate-binding domain-containing protein [uncultured Marinobacter sp.]